MLRTLETLALCSGAALAADPAWKVIDNQFSAVTIGISFKDDKVGWTSHTDGSSVPLIVRTDDGGATWRNVKNTTGIELLTMGIAALKSSVLADVATTGLLESSLWSIDGDVFRQSLGAPLVSQDIKNQAGRMVIAQQNGVCISTTGGALYSCKKVPLKFPGTGRYASSPSKDVIFFSAGTWPESQQSPHRDGVKSFSLTRNLHLLHGASGASSLKFAPDAEAAPPQVNGTYTAELWKSTDGGNTWKNLMTDEGSFYFNNIHCFDEKNCVVVGEGFADGKSPGARVYTTSDGENFVLSHKESTLGTESLMAAFMVSPTEHWVGGTAKTGGFMAPTLLLHSKDGAKTYANENSGIVGQLITSFDFVSGSHAYATAVNALQVSSLLEFGGNTPPAPSPSPTPGGHHYEKPPCQAGEAEASIQGTTGKLCAPPCDATGACPTDPPTGVTATPACILKDQSGNQYCALECTADAQCDKVGGSMCSIVTAGKGVCTYAGSAAMGSVEVSFDNVHALVV